MSKIKARTKPIAEWPEALIACGCHQSELLEIIVDVADTLVSSSITCGGCGTRIYLEHKAVRVVSGMQPRRSGYVPYSILDLDEGIP